MKIGVELLFQKVMECTDALIGVCRHSDETNVDVDSLARLLEQREGFLKVLGERLELESDTEKYRPLYEECKQKEMHAEQLLKHVMDSLSAKLKDAKLSRSATTNYDAYNRLMPYGAFIDHKK